VRLHSHAVGLAAVAIAAAAAVAQPPPSAIKSAPVAAAVRHPGPLVVREEGTGEISKAYGTPHWAASITAEDKSFADVNILLIDAGSFLTAAVTQRFAQAIAAPQRYAWDIRQDIVGRLKRASDSEDRAQAERELSELDRLRAHSPLIRPIRLANGGRGYSAVLGFSRIDTTFATVMPSPDGRYELLVSVATPFSSPAPAAGSPAARYWRALHDRPLDTVQAMAMSVYQQLFPSSRDTASSGATTAARPPIAQQPQR
jgi:hypothetical protein